MNCPNCGVSNLDTSSICVNCGRPLNTPQQTSSYTPPQPPPATPHAPPPPPPHYAAAAPAGPRIPNYLVQSILVTLCCCLPFGIVAIIFAAQVNSKLAAGDIAGAEAASRNARTWCWVAFGVGLVLQLFWIVFYGGTAFVEGFRAGWDH